MRVVIWTLPSDSCIGRWQSRLAVPVVCIWNLEFGIVHFLFLCLRFVYLVCLWPLADTPVSPPSSAVGGSQYTAVGLRDRSRGLPLPPYIHPPRPTGNGQTHAVLKVQKRPPMGGIWERLGSSSPKEVFQFGTKCERGPLMVMASRDRKTHWGEDHKRKSGSRKTSEEKL